MGIGGVYQHASEAHLNRYVTEFEFRYNNRSKLGISDAARTVNAMRGIEGKRLTYRRLIWAYTRAWAAARLGSLHPVTRRLRRNIRFKITPVVGAS